MTYKKGDYSIHIERVPGFGKKKGLWIGKENQMVKMGCFGNDDKAEIFQRYLEYFLGLGDEPTWEGIR